MTIAAETGPIAFIYKAGQSAAAIRLFFAFLIRIIFLLQVLVCSQRRCGVAGPRHAQIVDSTS
jgi:hypothetical protein